MVRQKSYSDLDSLYLNALTLGVAHPELVVPVKTADYQNKFTGNDLHRYNAYAYIVSYFPHIAARISGGSLKGRRGNFKQLQNLTV